MASVIDICNLALSNIRAGSINSLTEASLQAQVCNLKYPFMRDRCLREAVWNFNKGIQALALVNVDIFNWAYAYSYPVNCLEIHRIIPDYEGVTGDASVISRLIDTQILPITNLRRQVSYEVFNFDDAKVIGCNETELYIGFAKKIEDPNLFSDDFILALSHLLASEIAISLVGVEKGRELRSDSVQLYDKYISAAAAADMNDGYISPCDSDYVTIRR